MKKRTVKQSRVISLLLAVMMIVTSLPFAGLSALAATTGDFEYEILEDGTAEISGYYGEAETVKIPATLDGYTVTSIGWEAFENCESLTSITIPDSVTSVGDFAFDNCTSLTSITIPDSVTNIGNYAFWDCDSLTNITMPDSVTSIGWGTFESCDSLTNITIPESVTSIGGNAFSECKSLTSITIPDGVTSIGEETFDNCTSLTSIAIPDSVTSIGDRAFYNCSSLASADLGEGVTNIGEYVFNNCSSLTSITVDKNNKNYSSQDGVLFSKEKTELIQYPIGNERTSYSIPNGVKSIGEDAFQKCSSLTSVTIPDSVTSIGDWAFYACGSLTSVDLGNGVTSIGDSAFEGCTGLTNITIPDSVTSIGDHTFEDCHSLTSINIPNSVTSIGNQAFSWTGYCNDDTNWENGVLYIGNHLIEAKSDEIPSEYSANEGTVTIADYAFAGCDSLASITIPSSVTSIGWGAFEDCDSLTSVNLGEGITSIGDYAFWGCDVLTSVTIPDSVASIGEEAFSACTSLTSITVDENNNYYFSQDGVLYNKEITELIQYPVGNERTSYIIPDGVTSIGYSAFESCESLTSITIPDSVTSIDSSAFLYTGYYNDDTNWENGVLYIGNHLIRADPDEISSEYSINEGTITIAGMAFSFCGGLASVTIPDSVTNIGAGAFHSCTRLTNITIPESVTSIGDNAFDSSALETIYGYENSYAQTYAEEYDREFVPLYTYENAESGITVDAVKSELPEDTELVVSVKEETEDSVTYDISLQSSGVEVQPTGSVTVKIPVPETMDGESVKVYRLETDGTMTDMNAVYKDGFMVFTTEHFSEYMLKAEASEVKAEPGDVNGDGKINALDVLIVKRYIAKYEDAKLEGDMFALADVSGDGKVNAKDALVIMQKIAKLITSFDEIK